MKLNITVQKKSILQLLQEKNPNLNNRHLDLVLGNNLGNEFYLSLNTLINPSAVGIVYLRGDM